LCFLPKELQDSESATVSGNGRRMKEKKREKEKGERKKDTWGEKR